MRRLARTLAALAVALAGIAAVVRPTSAQRVERIGAGDVAFDRRLDRLIEREDYLLVTRDTTIGMADTVPASVVVLDATLRLAGAVHGDLVSVDGNVFLRPTARVGGDVVNIGGGLYRSTDAEVRGAVFDRPEQPYTVEPTGEGYRIIARRDEPRLTLDGVLGFREPWYDRVNGLWVRWGAEYRLPDIGSVEPSLAGSVGFRTEAGGPTGGAALRLRRGSGTLSLGGAHRTATNEAWIRGPLRNALSFGVAGKDYRDYYEIDEGFAELAWWYGEPARRLTVRLGGRIEKAGTLGTGDPFSLFGDTPYRSNLPVDDGTINSVVAGLGGAWRGPTSALEADAGIELAGGPLGGDFSFGRFVVDGEWAMAAFDDHTLEIEWHGQGVMPGTGTLPLQRWTFVGGSGTLTTRDIAEFRGDRVLLVETDYIIPMPHSLRLPLLGSPDLELEHRIGMAWTEFLHRDLVQNLGVRLQFFVLYLRLMTEPADAWDALDFDVGVSWPFDDDRPWEEERSRRP